MSFTVMDEELNGGYLDSFTGSDMILRNRSMQSELISYNNYSLVEKHFRYDLPGRGFSKIDPRTKKEICWSVNNIVSCKNNKHVELKHNFCFRYECNLCYKIAIMRASLRIENRLSHISKLLGINRLYHYTVSPYQDLEDYEFKMLYPSFKYFLMYQGSVNFFHAFRYKPRYNKWVFSPHFHVITNSSFVNSERSFHESGFVIKNISPIFTSTVPLVLYELGHSVIDNTRIKQQMYRWHGLFGCNKWGKIQIVHGIDDRCPECLSKREYISDRIQVKVKRNLLGQFTQVKNFDLSHKMDCVKSINSYQYYPSRYNRHFDKVILNRKEYLKNLFIKRLDGKLQKNIEKNKIKKKMIEDWNSLVD